MQMSQLQNMQTSQSSVNENNRSLRRVKLDTRLLTPMRSFVSGLSPKRNFKMRLSPLGHLECTDKGDLKFLNRLINHAPNLRQDHIFVNPKLMNEVSTNYHERLTQIVQEAISSPKDIPFKFNFPSDRAIPKQDENNLKPLNQDLTAVK